MEKKKKPQNYRTWFFSLLYKVKKACGPNSLFYKYLSVIFLYTNEYFCVQGQENSRMISQTPNKSGRTRGAQTGYHHITGSPSRLHDGNRLTSIFHINFSSSFASIVLSQRMSPTHVSLTDNWSQAQVCKPAPPLTSNSLDANDYNFKMFPWSINGFGFVCLFFFTKQQTDVQQRNELQHLRMVTFIDK